MLTVFASEATSFVELHSHRSAPAALSPQNSYQCTLTPTQDCMPGFSFFRHGWVHSVTHMSPLLYGNLHCRNLLRLFLNAACDVISTDLKNSVLVVSGRVRPTKYPVIAETCSCLAPFTTWGFLLAMLPPPLYPYSGFCHIFP